jgi:DNA-binding NtrC family response regulator
MRLAGKQMLNTLVKGMSMPASAYTLVVDDNPACREALSAALTLYGHTVITAESPNQALELLANEWPDVLLCDLVFNGQPDALTSLLESSVFDHIPCRVLLTGVDIERIPDAIKERFAHCLCKTVPVGDLLRIIETTAWQPLIEQSTRPSKKAGSDSAFFKLS